MPRSVRKRSSTGVYHVMIRGNEKRSIFSDDEDRQKFIQILEYKNPSRNWLIYAMCLMDNHVHLIIDELDDNLSKIMQIINTSYAYYYNKKYNRCGHLFQDRYKSEAIETDSYLLAAVRYIHKNPVQAGIVDKLEEYRWSSYHAYLNTNAEYTRIIDSNRVLELFSINSTEEARELFKEFMNQDSDDKFIDCEDTIKIAIENIDILNYLKDYGLTLDSLKSRENAVIRNQLIRELKLNCRLSFREISALLEISKSTVHNAYYDFIQ